MVTSSHVRFSLETKNKIREDYLGGSPIKEITARYACSDGLVWGIVKGLRRTETKKLAQSRIKRDADFVRRYLAGESPYEFCKEYGVTFRIVYLALKKAGIKARTAEEAARRYQLNQKYFDSITAESAYWLGFILADGCVTDTHKLSLGLAHKDGHHVYRFRYAIGATHPIKYEKKTISILGQPPKETESDRLWLTSQHMTARLIDLGVTPRKSLTHGTPKIPSQFYPQMYLGYFDGDGSLHQLKNRASNCLLDVVSTETFVNDFSIWALQKLNVKIHIKKHHASPVYVANSATETALRLMTHLYESSDVFLMRKFQVYSRVIDAIDQDPTSRLRKRLEDIWPRMIALKGKYNG